MKQVLNKLIRYESLSKSEAYDALSQISKGDVAPAQVAAFLTVFMMRPITVDELSGFRSALLDFCIQTDLSDFDPIDLCGTGGDGKDTFNISTLASFVTAGCGIPVAKHGNYGVTSTCGSSNVLEELGIRFSNDKDFLRRSLDEAGICIMHAPLFHPAMKHVGPIRRELGVPTFFNMLGPLVNPAFVKNQVSGVFNLELARKYHYLFQQTDMNYSVIHGLDGYDEISLTGDWKLLSADEEKVFSPTHFSTETLHPDQIGNGKTIKDASRIFTSVLENKSTKAQSDVVCANAAPGISLMKDISLTDAFQLAKESLTSGKALKSFQKLQHISL
ncbi:anthranilate phosphoribosyltransferase [Flavobacterium silvaticum]|uniref:Anthranilate phosphoribosyltransferase n=1 Tax=Flavobacterium silvaticum TaxID=1852020 RepID=A0A972FRS7_9FLAO|nr:anthranilate phosphoribosyltransferase [Flavobacterium silvaticum]NMH26812.1 anthranilate phosphoribosyltransferase [Flavobacterium silvaticum]